MKVAYYPNQPHCFAFGGFDMQMSNTLKAVCSKNVEAFKLDIWSRNQNFDIIHLWGVSPHNYQIIEWAKKANIKIVATILFPYSSNILWLKRINNIYKKHFKIAKYYYNLIDKIIVLNMGQAVALSKYYSIPISKIEIIPNIVGDVYFENKAYGKSFIDDFILCTGNISARKNQFKLATACVNLNVNLVLIGNVLTGEEEYSNKILDLVIKNSNLKWLTEIEEGSSELASFYYNCKGFALISNEETQPISALEAVAVGKPILFQNKPFAKQRFFENAILIKNDNIKSIENGIRQMLTNKKSFANPHINECTFEKVGDKYARVYFDIFSENTSD